MTSTLTEKTTGTVTPTGAAWTPAENPVPTRNPGLADSGGPVKRPAHAAHLTDADVAEIGRRLDAIRAEVMDSRGASDAAYIRRVIKTQRVLEVSGRGLLAVGAKSKALWAAGTVTLGVAKILENMEIGHNVIHGQWDWMRDPDIHSSTWEWDFVAPASGWKHTHNDLHHTWTNVVGKDSDVGYDLLRVTKDQPWEPYNILNPVYNAILAPFFEWGIAFYDLEIVKFKEGEKSKEQFTSDLKALGVKALKQAGKDYVATPAVGAVLGGGYLPVLAGTFTANCIRNIWAHSVIFCGHFPDGVEFFSEEMIEGETRGDWYLRQMLGSCNISGSTLMHLMTGNLSHQIEHHLFPDLPSNRYAEVAPKVKAICEEFNLPYVEGPMYKQVWQSWRTIARLALP